MCLTEVDGGSSSFVTSDPDDLGFGVVRPAHRLNDEYVGVVIGSLAALIVLLVAVFVIVYLRHRSCKCLKLRHRLRHDDSDDDDDDVDRDDDVNCL